MIRMTACVAVVLIAGATLTGCVPAVIAVGAGGTALVATDRRTTGTQVDDEGVELKIAQQANAQYGDRIHLNVTSYNGIVLLTGEVPDQGVWASVGNLAKTTEKVRVVTERNQQVARIDYEQDTDASGAVERAVVDAVERTASDARALLVSDYLKGAITRPVIEALLRARSATGSTSASLSGERPPLIVDPKIPHLSCYAGATIVTPNHHEAEVATHIRIRNDDDAHQAARAFRDRARCEAVLITRGEHGMWLSEPAGEGSIAAVAREVADVTGAGDTVVATLALALAAGATMTEAAMLANQAAGIVVGKFGPSTVTREELLAATAG